MKIKKSLPALLVLSLFGSFVPTLYVAVARAQSISEVDAGSTGKFRYPVARKGDQVDDYHGTKVADPYRWMENPDSAETRAWVEAENKVTFSYLEQIPFRQAIKDRMNKLLN